MKLALGIALALPLLGSALAAQPAPASFKLVLKAPEPRIRKGKLETVIVAKSFPLQAAKVARSRQYGKLSSSLLPDLLAVYKKVNARQPQEAYFENVAGSWVATQQTGWRVDKAKTEANLLAAIKAGKPTAELALTLTEPRRSVRGWAERGILYHYGSGSSSFAGSPSFRVKNIQVGAKRLEERYVEPGQDFDFNAYVGEIDREAGFVPGFVISGGTLTKEDGGGICQVSTTIFRAAYNAGLPITERHQHSHRVRYYDPVGFEATVYAPAKNFKFRNDTGKPLFIQASWDLRRQTLRFDLFGTRPDRKVVVSRGAVTNVLPAASPSFSADPSVPLGRARQIDVPARGMTVSITRRVTLPDGTVRKDETRSVYKPWGAVYAVNPRDPRANAN